MRIVAFVNSCGLHVWCKVRMPLTWQFNVVGHVHARVRQTDGVRFATWVSLCTSPSCNSSCLSFLRSSLWRRPPIWRIVCFLPLKPKLDCHARSSTSKGELIDLRHPFRGHIPSFTHHVCTCVTQPSTTRSWVACCTLRIHCDGLDCWLTAADTYHLVRRRSLSRQLWAFALSSTVLHRGMVKATFWLIHVHYRAIASPPLLTFVLFTNSCLFFPSASFDNSNSGTKVFLRPNIVSIIPFYFLHHIKLINGFPGKISSRFHHFNWFNRTLSSGYRTLNN